MYIFISFFVSSSYFVVSNSLLLSLNLSNILQKSTSRSEEIGNRKKNIIGVKRDQQPNYELNELPTSICIYFMILPIFG